MRLPATGELFEKKYRILHPLGAGGFAAVFRARDLEVERDVAIKILAPQEGGYGVGTAARFMREARVLASLQDPHTIRLFDFGEASNGLLYMVFQFVAGQDLAGVLNARGALPAPTAVHVTTQVLEALAEAHAAGVLHRDIKPANILIHEYMGDEFAVKLIDFGIAKADADGGASLTRTGMVLGTPRYMSPEQLFGEPVTPAADIYSLGLVLMEMLTGNPAIDGDQKEILRQQTSSAPLVLPPGVAWPALRAVVERMVAREPAQRFQSALQAAESLRVALTLPGEWQAPVAPSGTRVMRVATETARPALPPGPRRGRGAPLFALAAVALAAALLWGFLRQETPSAPAFAPRTAPTALLRTDTDAALPPPSAAPATVADAGRVDDASAATSDAEVRVEVPDGCGQAVPLVRDRKNNLTLRVAVDGRTREIRYWPPPEYDPSRRYPVVMALTFRNHDAGDYIARAQLHTMLAREQDFVIIAPEPLNKFDPWVEPEDADFLRAAPGFIASHLCIDRKRVYGTGHDQGATILRELACDMPFSAIAMTGDGIRRDETACDSLRGVPALRIIGEEDYFVPVRGGAGCAGGDFLSHAANEEIWRRRNGCMGDGRPWAKVSTQCKLWECSEGDFASCLAPGGHYLRKSSWTIMDPSGCAAPPLQHPVGETTWRFFTEHGVDLPEQSPWFLRRVD